MILRILIRNKFTTLVTTLIMHEKCAFYNLELDIIRIL